VSFVEAIKVCFHKYATFDGRASRSEFWWFYLFTSLVLLAGYMVQGLFSLFVSLFGVAVRNNYLAGVTGLVSFAMSVALFALAIALMIPLLAVGCRRLHDRDQSGWLQLLMVVPCGSIVLIVFWVLEGNPGPNPYGPPTSWVPIPQQ
jgi:uncharacterized membrane protein YhaH (DUF805 family)